MGEETVMDDVFAREGFETGFAGCVNRLAAVVDSRMTVREIVATAYLAGRTDSLDALDAIVSPMVGVERDRVSSGVDDVFARGYVEGVDMTLSYARGLRSGAVRAASAASCVVSHPSVKGRVSHE